MTTSTSLFNTVMIDTGPPGPHSAYKILRIANVEGGSGNYRVTWRPICDLTEVERQDISCLIDYRDPQLADEQCSADPECTFFGDETTTCCRTGECGGPDIFTRYRTGKTDRELVVTIDNIPQFSQNIGDACQLIFHWEVEDLDTGDRYDGCCGVAFQWRVITPPPLTVEISNCSSTTHTVTVDTGVASPSASTALEIITVTGGVGPYSYEWEALGSEDTSCNGRFSATSPEGTPQRLEITNDLVEQFYVDTGCTQGFRWTVRDLGITNEQGEYIGRVETGTCSVQFDYAIETIPELTVSTANCGSTVTIDTGPAGPHSGSATLQIGTITGGSGTYTTSWSTTPVALTGDCVRPITAAVNILNPKHLTVSVSNIPQFTDNTSNICSRTYRATITDTITGAVALIDCTVSFHMEAITLPPLTVTTSGCDQTLTIDSGSCSPSTTASGTVTITNISDGSGDYTITWGTPTSTGSCGSYTATTSNDTGQGPQSQTITYTATIDADNTSSPCVVSCPYTVMDNITGASVSNSCTITIVAEPTTACPPLSVTTTGCGQTINHDSSSSTTTAKANLDVSVSGGSGSYTISWNTTPTAASGTCYTANTAIVNLSGTSRRLQVWLTGFASGANNTSSPCSRTYSYTVTDTFTGETSTGSCTVNFSIEPTFSINCADFNGIPQLTQTNPTYTVTSVDVPNAPAGSTYLWSVDTAASSPCVAGHVTTTIATPTGATTNVTFEAVGVDVASAGCYIRIVCDVTAPDATYSKQCDVLVSYDTTDSLTAGVAGCGSNSIEIDSHVATSGSTTLTINPSPVDPGGVSAYTYSWTLGALSGAGCPAGMTVGLSGDTTPTVTITASSVPIDHDAGGSVCTQIVNWTVDDPNDGSGGISGQCSVPIIIEPDVGCVSYTSRTCGTSSVTATTSTVTRTMTVNGLAGGFGSGTYDVTWTISNSCGSRIRFQDTASTTSYSLNAASSASKVIEFLPGPVNQSGSCSATVTATIVSANPTDSSSVVGLCAAAPVCSYSLTYNTMVPPGGTISCGAGAIVLTRDSNTVTRTYSITGATNTTGYSWSVSGCSGITVTHGSTTGSSFTVTYSATTSGGGLDGLCTATVSCVMSGPGGTTVKQCSQSVDYDTRPPAIEITSVTNCGQTGTIGAASSNRTHTFSGMTINHTGGAGGPYVYEWVRLSVSGSCSGVTWTPATSSSQTVTPSVTVPTNTTGTCSATYQARVRDAAGTWSAPVTCVLGVNYTAIPPLVDDSDTSGTCSNTSFANIGGVCSGSTTITITVTLGVDGGIGPFTWGTPTLTSVPTVTNGGCVGGTQPTYSFNTIGGDTKSMVVRATFNAPTSTGVGGGQGIYKLNGYLTASATVTDSSTGLSRSVTGTCSYNISRQLGGEL